MQVEITFEVTPDGMFSVKPDGSREPVNPGKRLDELERETKRMAAQGFQPIPARVEVIERTIRESLAKGERLHEVSALNNRLTEMSRLLSTQTVNPLERVNAEMARMRELFLEPAINRGSMACDLEYARGLFIRRELSCSCDCHSHN